MDFLFSLAYAQAPLLEPIGGMTNIPAGSAGAILWTINPSAYQVS